MRGVSNKILGGIVQCNYAYYSFCSLILRKFYSKQFVIPPSHSLAEMKRALLLGVVDRMEAGGKGENDKSIIPQVKVHGPVSKTWCKNCKLAVCWLSPVFGHSMFCSQNIQEVKLVADIFTDILLWKY